MNFERFKMIIALYRAGVYSRKNFISRWILEQSMQGRKNSAPDEFKCYLMETGLANYFNSNKRL